MASAPVGNEKKSNYVSIKLASSPSSCRFFADVKDGELYGELYVEEFLMGSASAGENHSRKQIEIHSIYGRTEFIVLARSLTLPCFLIVNRVLIVKQSSLRFGCHDEASDDLCRVIHSNFEGDEVGVLSDKKTFRLIEKSFEAYFVGLLKFTSAFLKR